MWHRGRLSGTATGVLRAEPMHLPSVPAGARAKAWPPVLAARVPGWRGALHSHHALHFVLAIDGELRFRTSAAEGWRSAAGVLTAPHAPHAIDAPDTELLLVFLDPESDAAAAFRAALDGAGRPLSTGERDALVRLTFPDLRRRLRSYRFHLDDIDLRWGVTREQAENDRALDICLRQIDALVRGALARTWSGEAWTRDAARALGVALPAPQRAIHPKVRKLLAMLRAGGLEEAASLEGLASALALSPSRLMHVFTASVGTPLRPYLAWLRLQRAATSIVGGASMGEAAHAAGFADAAHMSRTFKRMLGIAPSFLRPMRCLR